MFCLAGPQFCIEVFPFFSFDLPLPVFSYLVFGFWFSYFGFHLGHQLIKACFLVSTYLSLCVCQF